MLIESTAHLPSVWLCSRICFIAPTTTDILRIGLRWAHFVAGITWIGLLYFFNLVNVPVQKALDAGHQEKGKSGSAGTRALVFSVGAQW